MKKAGLKMSFMMGAAMSITLSLIGLLSARKFTLPGFFTNVLISFSFSFLLGLAVPVKQLGTQLVNRLKLQPGSLKARAAEALLSDVIYTPLMTTVMTYLAYRQARAHGAPITFASMWLPSLLISLTAAFGLVFIFTPLFTRIAFRDAEVRAQERRQK